MKKNIQLFSGKVLLPALFAGMILAGCHSADTDPATTVGEGHDSSMMHHDESASPDHTMSATPDSGAMTEMAGTDSKMKADTGMVKKETAGKKKGKVSLVADEKKADGKMEMDKEGYYSNTEVLPAFPGGQKALERFFEDNIVYPDAATDNSAEGTVRLTFAVDENGKLYNPVAIGTPIGYGIEDEAIRVVKKMPTWTPGKIKGKNVKTRFTLPVKFQMM